MKQNLFTIALAVLSLCGEISAQQINDYNMDKLKLTQAWDKKFPKSDIVTHRKATFKNRFGITLAADLYEPIDIEGTNAAIAVAGPFGAVKEQVSGRYAQTMAERGFVTLAFDPSFTGESDGKPRNTASPDINTEDFSAAIDYLASLPEVDADRIGVIGICGWGGMAINAAAIDTRIKATVTVTMYNMSEQMHNGYLFAPISSAELHKTKEALNAQRTMDYRSGSPEYIGGFQKERPVDAPQFILDYWDFYMSPERGYIDRAPTCSTGWTKTTPLSFINTPLDAFAGEIETPVMLVHGEKAHSRYFSEEVFVRLKGDNKRLLIVPGANHTDLYDNLEFIPYDEIEEFFNENLKSPNSTMDKGMHHKQPMASDGIVRLSKIEVYPQYLDEYLEYAREVGEISLCTEPGVLTMYAVQEKENPCRITILETYASNEAYRQHISSPHFQKYKQCTLHMVKDLVLADQNAVNPENVLNNYIK